MLCLIISLFPAFLHYYYQIRTNRTTSTWRKRLWLCNPKLVKASICLRVIVWRLTFQRSKNHRQQLALEGGGVRTQLWGTLVNRLQKEFWHGSKRRWQPTPHNSLWRHSPQRTAIGSARGWIINSTRNRRHGRDQNWRKNIHKASKCQKPSEESLSLSDNLQKRRAVQIAELLTHAH